MSGPDIKGLVDLVGVEPTTSSMPWKRAPNCATGPRAVFREVFPYDNIDSRLDRDQAWQNLCDFTRLDRHRRRALALEACVAA